MKLIRDKLAHTEWSFLPEGRDYVRPVHDHGEHMALLGSKILEEAAELLRAGTPAEVTEELADLLSVVRSYANVVGLNWSAVVEAANQKDELRGAFTEGTVWDL